VKTQSQKLKSAASIDKEHQAESTDFRTFVVLLIRANTDKNTEYDQLNLDFKF